MSHVFVVDTTKHPLAPVHPAYARLLLKAGKAAIWRRYPFSIILKEEGQHSSVESFRLKLDPGSKTTGLALVNETTGEVMWAAELTHRGHEIKKALDDRRAARRSRRRRHTRYRKPRFANRRRKPRWLAPSLLSRIHNIVTWVARLRRLAPITALSQELVRFDLQALTSPEIQGVEYQQGTLFGYELREYILEKWQRTCAYCGKQGVALQVEHIVAKAKGGTDCVSNLCLACEPCNRKKGTLDVAVFLKKKPEVATRVLAHAQAPLKDAAAVNATRWALFHQLETTGLPVEVGSGGLTKYNRTQRGLPKTHWLDAACVGKSTPDHLSVKAIVPLLITSTGHGRRQSCLMDAHGFPRTKPKTHKRVAGFQTGDMVRAVVEQGVHSGTYVGKVAIRRSGSFNITTAQQTVQGIAAHWCHLLHRCDGYRYSQKGASVPSRLKA